MTYTDQYAMSQDRDLRNRITACAAQQVLPAQPMLVGRGGPEEWASRQALCVTGQPGWAQAWASARAAAISDPGRDQGVISDGMILSAVQAVLAGGTAPAP